MCSVAVPVIDVTLVLGIFLVVVVAVLVVMLPGPVFCRLGKRVIAYSIEDLDAWLMAQRRRSTSDFGGGQ